MANGNVNAPSGSRSLLERVSGRSTNNVNMGAHDAIQARIDNIVGASPDPNGMIMQPGFVPEVNAMQMAASAAANPLMLQEMMMNQMAMMAAMGMMNPANFAMQGDMGMFGGGMGGFQGQPQLGIHVPNGRGNRNGRGRGPPTGRGRGGPPATQPELLHKPAETTPSPMLDIQPTPPSVSVAIPITPIAAASTLSQPRPTGFVAPTAHSLQRFANMD
jgi:hypothetical protein